MEKFRQNYKLMKAKLNDNQYEITKKRILHHLTGNQSKLEKVKSKNFSNYMNKVIHKEAANVDSKNGVAFLIKLLHEEKIQKLSPEKLNSKLEIRQTLIKRRAISPKVAKTYK